MRTAEEVEDMEEDEPRGPHKVNAGWSFEEGKDVCDGRHL